MSEKREEHQRAATPEATARLVERVVAQGAQPDAYRPLGKTGLRVSGIGFGAYRVQDGADEHQVSIQAALAGGCNLIDTSTNYADGASELLVGAVMESVTAEGRRSEVVVVSKAGYVQGANLDAARKRAADGRPYPDMVEYMDGCWHCIHPSFLIDQLALSLERCRVECVDVYLLHNPEYFLGHLARNREGTIEERRERFYERLERAFQCLEAQVAAGRISAYGVSSNTFVVPPNKPKFTCVWRMLEIARRVGGPDHHFQVVQCPMNLLEPGAATVANTGPDGTATFLEVCEREGLGVLTNRPLNALSRGALVRLADFEIGGAGPRTDRLVRAVQRVEDEFSAGLGKALELAGDGDKELFRHATKLRDHAQRLGDVVRWDDYVSQSFSPELSHMVNQLDNALDGPIKAAWQLWLERYVAVLGTLVDGLRTRCARRTQRRSDRLAKLLGPNIPERREGESLSRKAIATLMGTPGVTTVLVGMRHRVYVEDAMGVLAWTSLNTTPELLGTVAREGVS